MKKVMFTLAFVAMATFVANSFAQENKKEENKKETHHKHKKEEKTPKN